MKIKFQLAYVVLGCATAFGLSRCLPEPNLPDNPLIEFQSFELNPDGSRELVIAFTDGDGDVGLSQGDTLPPHFCASCDYHYNLKCEYEELQDGEWVQFDLDP
jgi:hypothetical protein